MSVVTQYSAVGLTSIFDPSFLFFLFSCVELFHVAEDIRLNYSQQELIRRWDSERELFNDDIAHT